MKQVDTYYVKEFARLAGVTVRTLQFYDREGLLKPSFYTEAGHRLYQPRDLLRLQQILTLKYMGFSLDEIQRLLNDPVYNVQTSLKIQKEAIDQRIAQMQKVSQALEQTLNALSSLEPNELNWSMVTTVIQGVVNSEKWQWVNRYYTPEQQQFLVERAKTIPPEEMQRGQQAWAEVMAAFEKLRAQGRSPSEPAAQELAAKMHELIEQFTGSDSSLRDSLRRMYEDFEKLPPEKRPFDLELQKYMTQVYDFFLKPAS